MAKILIVDDKANNLFALENVLKPLDVDIVKASSGDEALKATLHHEFALAILDVQMPEMDGYELANLLRQDSKTRHIPIIFLSAVYSDEANIFKGYESGGVDFLTKPFSPVVLLSKVRVFLEIHEQKSRLIKQKAELEKAVSELEDQIERRKRVEAELVRAKQEWERTFDSVPDLIAILDTQHRIIRVNRVMAQRLGAAPEACIGLFCYESVHGLHRPPAFCPCLQTRNDGQEHVAEIHVERLGGDFLISSTPLLDELGSMVGTVHVARDITDRKRMEVELRKARDELELRVEERTAELQLSNKTLREYAAKLERLNEELENFTFAASHDLQEPLRKIQTFCDMAIKKCSPPLDSSAQAYLDRVINSTNHMRELLRDLLAFSRVTAKVAEVKEIDLENIAREAADVFEASIKDAGCRIEIEKMPAIEADRAQMLLLFQNLIGNALKFRGNETPHIRITGGANGQEMCEICVRDNGIGFDQQFAEHIFKPFERLHSRNEYDGTGMGLAICRKVLDGHGGTIRAESEPGKGATFIIRLPIKRARLGSCIAEGK
jgi:PAS domain S-box-containing protein